MSSLYSPGQWIFTAGFIDRTTKLHHGIVYNLKSTHATTQIYYLATPAPSSGQYYQLNRTSRMYWGGNHLNVNEYCRCDMSYVKFYIDYAANNQDQMINLATMTSPGSKLTLNI